MRAAERQELCPAALLSVFVRKKRNESFESVGNDGFGRHFLQSICFCGAVSQCAQSQKILFYRLVLVSAKA